MNNELLLDEYFHSEESQLFVCWREHKFPIDCDDITSFRNSCDKLFEKYKDVDEETLNRRLPRFLVLYIKFRKRVENATKND